MEKSIFRKWNHIVAAVVFAVAAFTYLSTIEPTASFWDCGEFIASSYKLEVGHPPGNPVFQLIARFFTMFAGPAHAAVMVNAMSGLCSALTIFFLYLTIVFFARRMMRPAGGEEEYSSGQAIAIFGSGAVGALAYCFSDTFWFSAVEGEVYAMSSLFTAMVFWAMTKWYEQEDRRYADRWIVLISFLMGLSIGIHLLNLLTIPALVFLYYFKMREDRPYSFWEYVKILAISVVMLGFMVFLLVPMLPKIAAYFDLFFVNTLGLPFNTGAAFFMAALLGLCFWGLFRSLKAGKVFWNTALLCFTTIVIGFSLFSIVVIRSNAKTPTNEYQPDNAFTLVRYLSREQYGSTPLLYGQYFDAPYDIRQNTYWTPLGDRYKKADSPVDVLYKSSGKMLFPRMWSSSDRDPKYIQFYESYMNGKGIPVQGAKHKKPTFGQNLYFFFDFQLGWMYWRYFLWNFVGRQNEFAAAAPNQFQGNWESGIKPLDRIRLGNQDNAPDWVRGNKGKNHYFFLPLLLGLLGLFFQFDRDRRGCWLVFLLFFMTGIAIVIYLNQPPYQVRERDYAYAGSFYAFSIWIGFAVAALYSWTEKLAKNPAARTAFASASTAACLFVPALMAAQNWDDHDRSHRYTAVETAQNYLNSVGPNGLLVTHGDNDTFPLWYAQEVEGFRTDVRVCNTSLLGTDWYIDQMKYAINKSAPLNLQIGKEQYLYGTNEYIPIEDSRNQALLLSDVVAVFKHPEIKLLTGGGRKVDYWISRKMIVPVNKENVLKSGILSEKFAARIPDSIVLEIPQGKSYLTKPELFLLDFLSSYQWDRPLNLLNQGGDLNIGIKDYLMYDGYSYRFVPVKNQVTSLNPGLVDTDQLYAKITKDFTFDAIARKDYFVDYQNLYTHLGVMSLRNMFVSAANAFQAAGENDRALEMLDKCQEVLSPDRYPYDNSILGWGSNAVFPVEMVTLYYSLGQPDKAKALATELKSEVLQSLRFYFDFYETNKSDFEYGYSLLFYLKDAISRAGDKAFADRLDAELSDFMAKLAGKKS